MGHDIEFKDNRLVVEDRMTSLIGKILLEVAAELVSQTARNTKVDTGQTKNSWAADVKEVESGKSVATIGSPLMNAVYEEFGTGEYALNGNGRSGYWVYVDDGDDSYSSSKTGKTYTLAEAKRVVAIMRSKGLNAYYTKGKKPRRPFWKAYTTLKPRLIRQMQDEFKRGMQ